jgi:hypothetical protein
MGVDAAARPSRNYREISVADKHRYGTLDKFGGEHRQPVKRPVPPPPAVFDRNVLALDVAGLAQASNESGDLLGDCLRRCATQESNHWHLGLLRAPPHPAHGYRAAEKMMNLRRLIPSIRVLLPG